MTHSIYCLISVYLLITNRLCVSIIFDFLQLFVNVYIAATFLPLNLLRLVAWFVHGPLICNTLYTNKLFGRNKFHMTY